MEILSTASPIDILLVYLIAGIGSLGLISFAADVFGMMADFYKKLSGGNKWLAQFLLLLVGSHCLCLAVSYLAT